MYVYHAPADTTSGHDTDDPGTDARRDDATTIRDLDETDGTEIASVTLDEDSDSDAADFDPAPRDCRTGATLLVDVRDSQPDYECRSENDNCPGPDPDADSWLCFECYQRLCSTHSRETANEVLDRQLR